MCCGVHRSSLNFPIKKPILQIQPLHLPSSLATYFLCLGFGLPKIGKIRACNAAQQALQSMTSSPNIGLLKQRTAFEKSVRKHIPLREESFYRVGEYLAHISCISRMHLSASFLLNGYKNDSKTTSKAFIISSTNSHTPYGYRET